MRVLTFTDHYLPGYRAGGPIRAVANLVEALAGEVHFRIVTRDHDGIDTTPYPGIVSGEWQRVGAAEVMYLRRRQLSLPRLARLLRSAEYDAIYLNSFNSRFSMRVLLLRRLGAARGVPVVLAPRGEFSAGALALKPRRKALYQAAAARAGLLRGLVWQASSPHEADDIRRALGGRVRHAAEVFVTPELPSPLGPSQGPARAAKVAGRLNVVFLARIARMKNLDGLLRILGGVTAEVDLDAYGPVDDAAYWSECRRLVAELPPNVRFRHHGELPHERVQGVLARSDLFVLPTQGENFGHAIQEALAAGTPVLVSDRTRWRGLEARQAGWDLPLDDVAGFRRVIDRVAAMGPEEHGRLSRGAAAFARDVAGDGDVELNRRLFRSLVCPLPAREAARLTAYSEVR